MNFNMTGDEAEVVKEILEQSHRELLLEIARAEHHEFRAALQQREEVLKRLLDKLGVPEPAHF
jgi:mevalonate kinase